MPKFACQYTDSRKKPEVTPKRGLIALVVDTQSNNKYGERSGKASLSSDNIPGVPEVTPKRGLIALVVDTQSNNKYGERSGKASLSSDNIPGVSVSEELTD